MTNHETQKISIFFMKDDNYYHVSRRSVYVNRTKVDDKYKCDICNKTFKKMSAYSYHYTTHYRQFSCPEPTCDKIIPVIGMVYQHFGRKHMEKGKYWTKKDGKYNCNKCEKKFKSEPAIYGHITSCNDFCYGTLYNNTKLEDENSLKITNSELINLKNNLKNKSSKKKILKKKKVVRKKKFVKKKKVVKNIKPVKAKKKVKLVKSKKKIVKVKPTKKKIIRIRVVKKKRKVKKVKKL